MRALETTRLLIRAFTPTDAETYSRLLDEAFGVGAYGSGDEKRVVFEHVSSRRRNTTTRDRSR